MNASCADDEGEPIVTAEDVKVPVDATEKLITAEELARWTHLRCKCGHPLDGHRDGFEWNRYNHGICEQSGCECPVYRPYRIVKR